MTGEPPPAGQALPPRIDTNVPHAARMWNYWLGGKDHYEVDREAGDQFSSAFPDIVEIARLSRHLLARIVRYLVIEGGVRQFLDIGTGLPTVDNTHDVAQRADPTCRIVYVDNDPLVLAHARALLAGTPEGATDYVDADLRGDPMKIITAAAKTLDLTQPVALMLMGIAGYVTDEEGAHAIVRRLMDALPPGSYLAMWDGVNVVTGEALDRAQEEHNEGPGVPYNLRTREEFTAFFDGLDLVEPGVVSLTLWRPDPDPLADLAEVDALCGVARKS
ncbi:SAM-dependent methyltransferase [Nonomuraea turkmeniaca]|uniref:SAM-dependent methyltransferase n=1 Tax=Nonomuraea turkmeniaca TaxID=103838 RepID=A0A5S4FFV5_9ACTN|nr:SAM-dependent methyltransferase [Nonomuraea turkmeniaca]TMR17911.1 SAM-dependent methyltransferase [Nonomuraea turkmeniaca]